MPKENNSKRNSSNLLNLDNEDFMLWHEHHITQLVVQFYKEKLEEVFAELKEAAENSEILSDIQQTKKHEEIRFYEDFIDLDYDAIVSHYEEDIDEDDTASVGSGIS